MIVKVALNKLFPQAKKIDKELFESIKEEGILAPVALFRIRGKYKIRDGTQRILIAKLLGHKEIVANVIDIDSERDVEILCMMHSQTRIKLTNEQYKDILNKVLSRGMPTKELATKLGKPVSWIKEKLK